MTQDLYYYEEGYFDPALGYFVYTADAESLEVGTFTVTAAVGVIRAASVSLTSAFTQTAVISHIEGADLFAFTNASLAAEVSRIRDNNVAVTAAFTQVTAGAKFIHFSSDQNSVVTVTANNLRVRFNEAAVSAAFSLACDATNIPGGIVQEAAGSLTSAFTSTSTAIKSVTASSAVSAVSNTRICGGVRYERPLVAESLNNVGINTSTKKFGQGSLELGTGSGYINYYATKDLVAQGNPAGTGDEFLLEFWFYSTSTRTNRTLFDYTNSAGTQQYWSFGFNSSGYLQFVIRGPSLNAFYTSSTTLSSNQWNHVAVSFSTAFGAGGISIWLNGSRIHNTSSVAIPPIPPDLGLLRIGNRATTGLTGYIDDLRVATAYHGSNTLIDIGRSPSSSTITVPTDRLYNDDAYTRFLGHFDLDNCDDVSDIELAQSLVAGTFTLSADVRKFGVVTAEAALTSTSTVVATGSKIHPGQADFTAVASVVTVTGRIRPQVADLTSTFTLAVDTQVIKVTGSNMSAEFSQAVDVTKQLGPITSDLSSTATLSAQAVLTNDIQANITAFGSLLAATGRIRPQVADLSSVFNLSVDSQIVKVSAANLNSQFTQTTVITKNFGPITADLNSQATVSAQATTIPGGSIVMSSQFTTSVVNQRLRNNLINSQVTASVTVDAIKVIVATSNQQAQFNQSTQALRIKQLSSAFNSIATELVAAARVGSALVDIQTVSTLTANAVTLPSGSVQMQAVTGLTVAYNRIKSFNAQLTSAFQPVINVTTSNDATAIINVVSSMSIGSSKIARSSASIVSTATMTVSASKVTNGISLEFTLGTLAASAKRIRNVQCQASVIATMNLNAGKRITASANLSVQGFVVVVGVLLYIDPDLIYMVPRETRSFKIRKENRLLVIDQENREYIVRGK
jgi:hypothetical protein